jgi:hypothetical protein
MTRYFLSEGAQERFSQARFDAIRTLGRIAKEEHCQFMLVCGDAFESNQGQRRGTLDKGGQRRGTLMQKLLNCLD